MTRSTPETDNCLDEPVCRICLSNEKLNPNNKKKYDLLINPCKCSGTMGLTHRSCLDEWQKMNKRFLSCEICKFEFDYILERPKDFIDYIEEKGYKKKYERGLGYDNPLYLFLCVLIVMAVSIPAIGGCIKGIISITQYHFGPKSYIKGNIWFLVVFFWIWIGGLFFTAITYTIDMSTRYSKFGYWRWQDKVMVIRDQMTEMQSLQVNLGRTNRRTTRSSIKIFLVLFVQWLRKNFYSGMRKVFCCCCCCCCCFSKRKIEETALSEKKMTPSHNTGDVIDV